MILFEFAAGNPVTAVVMLLLILCFVLGTVDRLTDARRKIAQAEADTARAALLRAQRDAVDPKVPPRPTEPPPPPPAPRMGKGS